MSKKATINGFTGGLSMDLNPLTNTKEVLSDAVNATLVTGNGDEMILLNDMGNIPLGELPKGYIPVGVKEYGGIAYIALYNPETKKGQLGTYPSPENYIYTNGDGNLGEIIYKDMDVLEIPISENIATIHYGADISIEFKDKFLKNYINQSTSTQNIWDMKWIFINKKNLEYELTPLIENNVYKLHYNRDDARLVLRLIRRRITGLSNQTSFIKKNSNLSDIPSELQSIIDNIPNNGAVIIFNSTYYWNCPDGQQGNLENVINGLQYTIKSPNSTKTFYYNHNSEYVSTKVETGGFKRNVISYYYIQSLEDSYTCTVTPYTYNTPLSEFSKEIKFNSSESTDSNIDINIWKYKILSNTNVSLTYGILFKNVFSSSIKNINIEFTDILLSNTQTRTIGNYIILDNLLEGQVTLDFLHLNYIYLTKISIILNNDNTYNLYRWINTSSLYNNCPLEDFGSNDIINYNNIEGTITLNSPDKTLLDKINDYSLLSTDTSIDHFSGKKVTTSNYYFKLDTNSIDISNDLLSLDIDTLPKVTTNINVLTDISSSTNVLYTNIGNLTNDELDFVSSNKDAVNNLSCKIISGETDDKITDNSTYFKISTDSIQKFYSKAKSVGGTVTFTNYFRPFVLDPEKVSANLCKLLKSNYYAFGYELSADYLPKKYLETQIDTMDGFAAYMVDRTSIKPLTYYNKPDDTYALTELTESNTTADDAPKLLTDYGVTTTLINEDMKKLFKDTINKKDNTILNRTFLDLNTSGFTHILKITPPEDLDFWKSPLPLTSYYLTSWIDNIPIGDEVIKDATSRRSDDNTINSSVDIFSLNTLITLKNNSDLNFLPTFNFWGSAYLVDGVQAYGTSTKTVLSMTKDSQNNGYNSYSSGNFINSGITAGDLVTKKDSNNESTVDVYAVGTPYKSLVPLWLDTQLIYSSINAIHKIPLSLEEPLTPLYVRELDMSVIIKTLVKQFSNYYLYTKGRILVNNVNYKVVDVNNIAFNNAYEIDVNIPNIDISISSMDENIKFSGVSYKSTIEKFLNKYFTSEQKDIRDCLEKLIQFNIILKGNTKVKVDVSAMNDDFDSIITSTNSTEISYPILLEPSYAQKDLVDSLGNKKNSEGADSDHIYKSNLINIHFADTDGKKFDTNNYYILEYKESLEEQDPEIESITAQSCSTNSNVFILTNNISDTESFDTLLLNSGNFKDSTGPGKYVIPNSLNNRNLVVCLYLKGTNLNKNEFDSEGDYIGPAIQTPIYINGPFLGYSRLTYDSGGTAYAPYCFVTYTHIPITMSPVKFPENDNNISSLSSYSLNYD